MRMKIQSLVRFNLLSLFLVIGCIGLFSSNVVSRKVTINDLKEHYPKVIYDLNMKIVQAHAKSSADRGINYAKGYR